MSKFEIKTETVDSAADRVGYVGDALSDLDVRSILMIVADAMTKSASAAGAGAVAAQADKERADLATLVKSLETALRAASANYANTEDANRKTFAQ